MLRVRELRKAAGLSQMKLAAADLSLETVRRADQGKSVSLGTLAKFALALGVEVRDLFEEAA